jgi:hypothetical protein
MEDLYGEIRNCVAKKQRVLVHHADERMAEDLSAYLAISGSRSLSHSRSRRSSASKFFGSSSGEFVSWSGDQHVAGGA